MKILLIHPTFWPTVGGAESIMRQHAELLSRHGHQVLVLTGRGQASNSHYKVQLLEELDPEFPLNLQVKHIVDNGQTDGNFGKFSSLLKEKLAPFFSGADLVFTHGVLTTHFNLALTDAVAALTEHTPTVAWTHDLTASNHDYSLPNPTKYPWSLMSTAHADVTYVAPSEARRQELVERLKLPGEAVPVIPNGIDPETVWGLDHELAKWQRANHITGYELVLYCPSKLLQRKNVDLAIMMTEAIRKTGIDACLIITAPTDAYTKDAAQYIDYLRNLVDQLQLTDCVYFLSDHMDVTDAVWSRIFLMADVLLFPSRYEAFGLPAFEAPLFRLPCWAAGLPPHTEHDPALVTVVPDPDAAAEQARIWMSQEPNQRRKRVLHDLDWDLLYEEKIHPLLNRMTQS